MKAEGDRPGTCSSGETRQTGILSHSIKRKGCTVIPLAQEGGAGSGATHPRSALTSRLSSSFTLPLCHSLSFLVFEWDNAFITIVLCLLIKRVDLIHFKG